jgi:hypothetical protein
VDTAIFEKRLSSILKQYGELKAKSEYEDLSDLSKTDRQALVTRAIAAVNQISGSNSAHANEISRILGMLPQLHLHTSSIMGITKALLDDLKEGYAASLIELVRGDIFSDFLEMAHHLCESGYKDAAAVIAGSTLESHSRNLCLKGGISVQFTKAGGEVVPKKAETMNSDLAAANVYSKLDQKSITAWLDLRNKAAHGKYAEYSQDQVLIMVLGIRDFIARNPA